MDSSKDILRTTSRKFDLITTILCEIFRSLDSSLKDLKEADIQGLIIYFNKFDLDQVYSAYKTDFERFLKFFSRNFFFNFEDFFLKPEKKPFFLFMLKNIKNNSSSDLALN